MQSYDKTTSLATLNDIDDIFIRYVTDDLLGSVSHFRDGIEIEGKSIIADSNNNSYITGTINLDFGYSFDGFVGKVNSTGDLVWYESVSKKLIDKVNDIAISSDQQYGYIVGETKNNTEDLTECFISCVNLTNGVELWDIVLNKSLYSISGYSIAVHNDCLYVSGVEEAIYPHYSVFYVFLACVNSTDQSLLWMNTCSSGPYDSQPMLEINEPQSEIILVYSKSDTGSQHYQYSIQKYDLNGSNTGNFLTNSTNYPKINDFVILNSDSILLTGDCIESMESAYRDVYVAKYSFSSENLEEFIFGNQYQDEIANGIIFYDSTDIFVAGYLISQITNREAAFLLNMELDGTLNWFRESMNFHLSTLNDIVELSNHKIVLIGTAQYTYDFFYLRLLFSITSDNDRDSLSDNWEPIIGTDPNKYDTDGDGYSDAEELFASTDPLNPRSFPGRRRNIINLGISFFVFLTVGFFIFQLYITIRRRRYPPKEKQTQTQKFINFFKEKIKRKSK
jgi:hypothetical protein